MGFCDDINPIKLLGKGIDAVGSIGKTIVSAPLALAKTAIGGVTQVASTVGNVVTQNVKNISGGAVGAVKEVRGGVTDTVTQARGAINDTGKNLMLPLAIGAAAFGLLIFMQINSKK